MIYISTNMYICVFLHTHIPYIHIPIHAHALLMHIHRLHIHIHRHRQIPLHLHTNTYAHASAHCLKQGFCIYICFQIYTYLENDTYAYAAHVYDKRISIRIYVHEGLCEYMCICVQSHILTVKFGVETNLQFST